jgi:hypothetical protein
MIKYDLPPEPPQLTTKKARLTRTYKATGTIWNKSWLREAVFQKSFGKCCYSDIKLGEEGKYMEIDHFLPKSIYPDSVVKWDNLNPSCKTCNLAKRNYNPKKVYILNPFCDDPKEYLYFENYRYRGKDKNGTGKQTVKVLDLNNHTQFVLKREQIGSKIKDMLQLFVHFDNNKKRLNSLKNLMRTGDRHEEYAALTSTVILSDVNFRYLEIYLNDNDLWDEELDALKAELVFCALLKNQSYLKNKDIVRTILVPDNENIQITIPKEYIGIKLEVIVFPVEEIFEKKDVEEKVTFTDFALDTPEYKFDREEAMQDLQHNQVIDITQ